VATGDDIAELKNQIEEIKVLLERKTTED
jgi:hypothetical protein